MHAQGTSATAVEAPLDVPRVERSDERRTSGKRRVASVRTTRLVENRAYSSPQPGIVSTRLTHGQREGGPSFASLPSLGLTTERLSPVVTNREHGGRVWRCL